MIDTHDCILNGNTITIEPAIKSECDCSNVKLTLSTVCRHACNDDKVHVKVDFDDVTNKPYALTYVDNMYKMLEDLGVDDLSGFVTNDELVNEINDVTDFISETYARKDEMPDTSNLATKDEIITEFKTINGVSILGDGDIVISDGSSVIDTSNFATKDEIPVITKQDDYSINSWGDGKVDLYSDDIFEKFVANITLSTILSLNYNNDMFWQHKDKIVIPLSYNNEAAYYITQLGKNFDYCNEPVKWWGDNVSQSTSFRNVCENGLGITMLQEKPTTLTKKLSNLDSIHTLVFPDYIESIGMPYNDEWEDNEDTESLRFWRTNHFNHIFSDKVIVLPMNIKSIYASSGLFDQHCTIIFKSLTAPEIVFDGNTDEYMFKGSDGSWGTIYYPKFYENNYETLRNILGDKWTFKGIVFDYQEYDS